MTPRKRLLIIAALVLLVIAVVVLPRHPAPPDVVLLPPVPLVDTQGRIPERWIPARWTWLHRTCRLFFGAPRQMELDITIIDVTNTVARIIADGNLGQPLARSNGVAAWLKPDDTPPRTLVFSTSMSAKIQTADRTEATMIMLGNQGNYKEDIFPRLNATNIDLSLLCIISSGMATNFAAAARAQLPYGHGLLLVDDKTPELSTNRTELLITAYETDDKGNRISRKQSGASAKPFLRVLV